MIQNRWKQVKKTKGRFAGKTLILGVTGSIAAYKAVSLARRIIGEGAEVHAVLTQSARQFIAPLTFRVLTGKPVGTELFAANLEGLQPGDETASGEAAMPHLSLAEGADLVLIAPATAHYLAKLAHGLADDLLSTMALAAHCPIVTAPAMDGDMWDHPAVRENVRTLRERGTIVLEPDVGPLASGKIGKGRFPEEDAVIAAVSAALSPRKDFKGRRVLVTAGPTQEALDPVRFLSNRSSGKMGWALAEAARDRGAEVVLVAGPTNLPKVAQVSWVPVTTSEEMHKAVLTRFAETDILIMAAAVADFRPARRSPVKVPKRLTPHALMLEPTRDILMDLPIRRSGQLVVGFAAETAQIVDRARRKLRRKMLDLIAANDVTQPGAGFGTDTNQVTLLDRFGRSEALPLMSKHEVAHRILDAVHTLLKSERQAGSPRRSSGSENT
jgi:phosphopantothenoylcysteine decarboxylase/phosphopantothenate--cysteine ligase